MDDSPFCGVTLGQSHKRRNNAISTKRITWKRTQNRPMGEIFSYIYRQTIRVWSSRWLITKGWNWKHLTMKINRPSETQEINDNFVFIMFQILIPECNVKTRVNLASSADSIWSATPHEPRQINAPRSLVRMPVWSAVVVTGGEDGMVRMAYFRFAQSSIGWTTLYEASLRLQLQFPA